MALRPGLNRLITIHRLSYTLSTKLQIYSNQRSIHAVIKSDGLASQQCQSPHPTQKLLLSSSGCGLKPLVNENFIFSRILSTSSVCYKTFKKKKQHAPAEVDEDTDDDDDDTESEDEVQTDSDDDDDDDDDDLEDVSDDEKSKDEARKDYKDVKFDLNSLRIDAVLSKGLNISRKKIEDTFLGTKLRINGKVVTKKGKKIKEGDILDVIKRSSLPSEGGDQTQQGEDTVSVMRVLVKQVLPDKTAKEKTRVILRRWKNMRLPKSKVE